MADEKQVAPVLPKQSFPAEAPAPRFPEGEEAVSEYEARKSVAEQIDQARAEKIRAGEAPKAALEQARAEVESRAKGAAPENR
jgi:hypothetical protein